MLKTTSRTLIILLVIFLTACRSTIPDLTPLEQPGDKYMSCDDIIAEMDEMNENLKIAEKNLTTQVTINVGLAAVGLYLFHVATGFSLIAIPIPLLFMDLSDGNSAEAGSILDRYSRLQDLYDNKWCSIRN